MPGKGRIMNPADLRMEVLYFFQDLRVFETNYLDQNITFLISSIDTVFRLESNKMALKYVVPVSPIAPYGATYIQGHL